MNAPGRRARWILPVAGLSLLAVAWGVTDATLVEWFRHPHRADATTAAVHAASAARVGWTVGAVTLMLMPWVLRDARVGLPPVTRVPRRWLWLAIALALALRLSNASQGLWYDEIASLGTYVAHGPGVIMGNAFTTANHPLQSLLSWCCLPLGVEPWIRLPCMLAGAAAVLGCWCIGRVTREGVGFASAMAFTMAVLPAAVNAGSEARGYALMIASSALSTGLLLAAMRHGGSWRWIAYTFTLAFGVWAHFVTAMVGAGHALFALGLLRRKDRRAPASGTLLAVACAALLALALWSPALPDLLRTRAQFASQRGDEPSLAGVQGLLLLWQLVGMTPLPMHKAGVDVTWAVASAVVPVVLLLAGAVECARDRSVRASLAVAALGLPLAIALASLAGSWLYARFLLFATPGTVLLLAAGAERALQGPADRSVASRMRAVRLAVPALAVAIFLSYDLGSAPRQPIREAVAHVAAKRAPGDAVLGIGIADDVVQWYAGMHDMKIEPTGMGGELATAMLLTTDARWVVALYPGHRHANGSAKALGQRGLRRDPAQGFPGWLDAGEGTVEVWQRLPGRP